MAWFRAVAEYFQQAHQDPSSSTAQLPSARYVPRVKNVTPQNATKPQSVQLRESAASTSGQLSESRVRSVTDSLLLTASEKDDHSPDHDPPPSKDAEDVPSEGGGDDDDDLADIDDIDIPIFTATEGFESTVAVRKEREEIRRKDSPPPVVLTRGNGSHESLGATSSDSSATRRRTDQPDPSPPPPTITRDENQSPNQTRDEVIRPVRRRKVVPAMVSEPIPMILTRANSAAAGYSTACVPGASPMDKPLAPVSEEPRSATVRRGRSDRIRSLQTMLGGPDLAKSHGQLPPTRNPFLQSGTLHEADSDLKPVRVLAPELLRGQTWTR
eukprot:Protomagalhaensia_wolfi_Nauph_80__1149@NODE_1679_length_1401_cov_7_407489_g1303_i0_p1_GENE_NODE_1679_length_1401_cov_7_407489_g1303_i0NODE_1679_length_1401_cov_7_407489_g1303_i0_p1_ORF_typecomplete_len327_score18_30Dscam_C/PF12355_8/3_5e02Dscam_C/PF12355_8/0_36_NODE_1679_length_1401_cov_7_407489_g1303_i0241004